MLHQAAQVRAFGSERIVEHSISGSGSQEKEWLTIQPKHEIGSGARGCKPASFGHLSADLRKTKAVR
jgi:hypothetical protein